jgi:hypothetical protein
LETGHVPGRLTRVWVLRCVPSGTVIGRRR